MTKGYDPVRSVRIGDEVWNKAKKRARNEGLSMSELLSRLTEGYASEAIDTPKIKLVFEK